MSYSFGETGEIASVACSSGWVAWPFLGSSEEQADQQQSSSGLGHPDPEHVPFEGSEEWTISTSVQQKTSSFTTVLWSENKTVVKLDELVSTKYVCNFFSSTKVQITLLFYYSIRLFSNQYYDWCYYLLHLLVLLSDDILNRNAGPRISRLHCSRPNILR